MTSPAFAFIHDWTPGEQAAGLVDLAIAFFEAARQKKTAELEERRAAIRAYLDAMEGRDEMPGPPDAEHGEAAPQYSHPLSPTPPEPAPIWRRCECGKRGYPSARAARLGSATNGLSIRVYQCARDHRLHHITKNRGPSQKRRRRYRDRRRALKNLLEIEQRKESR